MSMPHPIFFYIFEMYLEKKTNYVTNINPNVNQTVLIFLILFPIKYVDYKKTEREHNTSENDIMDFVLKHVSRQHKLNIQCTRCENFIFFNLETPPLNVHAAPNFFCIFEMYLEKKNKLCHEH